MHIDEPLSVRSQPSRIVRLAWSKFLDRLKPRGSGILPVNALVSANGRFERMVGHSYKAERSPPEIRQVVQIRRSGKPYTEPLIFTLCWPVLGAPALYGVNALRAYAIQSHDRTGAACKISKVRREPH